MSNNKPENPQVFPSLFGQLMPSGAGQIESGQGMTLRDYFAGQALAGILSSPGEFIDFYSDRELNPVNGVTGMLDLAAKVSYSYADAMLAAREKTNGQD